MHILLTIKLELAGGFNTTLLAQKRVVLAAGGNIFNSRFVADVAICSEGDRVPADHAATVDNVFVGSQRKLVACGHGAGVDQATVRSIGSELFLRANGAATGNRACF